MDVAELRERVRPSGQTAPSAPPFTATGKLVDPIMISNNTPHSPVPWSSGLCYCCEDVSSCCLTSWCPSWTHCRNCGQGINFLWIEWEYLQFDAVLGGLLVLVSIQTERAIFGGEALHRLLRPFLLRECALCQEYRQLQNQGFDMSTGWHGNVERQKRRAATMASPSPFPPQFESGMTR